MSIGYACLNIGTPNTNIRSVMQRNATPEKADGGDRAQSRGAGADDRLQLAKRHPTVPHQLGSDPIRFESGQHTRLAGNP